MNRLVPLNIELEHEGVKISLCPVVVCDDEEMMLIDTAYSGFLPIIEEKFEENDLDMSKLTKIFLTSHEIDHIGCLGEILEKYPGIEVISTYEEAPYLNKEKQPRRIYRLAKATDIPLDELSEEIAILEQMIRETPKIVPDKLVNNHNYFHFAGGIEVFVEAENTTLHFEEHQTIYAGDLISITDDNELVMSSVNYSISPISAVNYLNTLAFLQAKSLICFHGGEFIGNIQNEMFELTSTVPSEVE